MGWRAISRRGVGIRSPRSSSDLRAAGPRARRAARWALWLALPILSSAPSPAATAPAETHCRSGNLLSGLAPVASAGVDAPERLTDGVAAVEGDPWDSMWAAQFRDLASFATFDLGAETVLRNLVLQADSNDRYQVDLSSDGVTWQPLDPIPRQREPGLRQTRGAFHSRFRYLRIRPLDGDGRFAISEVLAYCAAPATRPEIVIRKTPTPVAVVPEMRHAAWGKMALALIALSVLGLTGRAGEASPPRRIRFAAGISVSAAIAALHGTLGLALGATASLVALVACVAWITSAGTERRALRLRTVAHLGLVVASGCAWTNFGFFSGHYLHYHDSFHYYLGSKYSREIGYWNLYRCTAIADAEDLGAAGVKARPIRDLVTKVRRPGRELLAQPERCKDAFDDARWQSFKADVAAFRSFMPASAWESLFLDHGYNPPPLWSLIGRALSFDDALTYRKLLLLALLDPLLYGAGFALLAWAFGSRAAALAAVVWAVGMPWDFVWTGGAVARAPWFLALLASIALAKKERYAASGASLAVSSLLRIFPILVAAGPLLAALGRRDPVAASCRRFVVGGLVAGVLLTAGSVLVVGTTAHRDFVSNILTHEQQPTRNDMGLTTVLAWHPERTAIKTYDFSLTEPRAPWAEMKRLTLRERAPLHVAIVLAVVASLWVASRTLEIWQLLSLGILLVGVGTELASYYFVMLAAVAPLAVDRPARYGALLLGVLLTQLVPIAGGLAYEAPYVASSALLLAALLLIQIDVVREALRNRRATRAPEEGIRRSDSCQRTTG